MGGSAILGIPIIGDIWDGVTGFFSDVAGWAIDNVIGAVTSWVMSGVLAMIEAIWSVIDNTTRVQANAEWFSVTADSPARLAFLIGVSVTALDADPGDHPRRRAGIAGGGGPLGGGRPAAGGVRGGGHRRGGQGAVGCGRRLVGVGVGLGPGQRPAGVGEHVQGADVGPARHRVLGCRCWR